MADTNDYGIDNKKYGRVVYDDLSMFRRVYVYVIVSKTYEVVNGKQTPFLHVLAKGEEGKYEYVDIDHIFFLGNRLCKFKSIKDAVEFGKYTGINGTVVSLGLSVS